MSLISSCAIEELPSEGEWSKYRVSRTWGWELEGRRLPASRPPGAFLLSSVKSQDLHPEILIHAAVIRKLLGAAAQMIIDAIEPALLLFADKLPCFGFFFFFFIERESQEELPNCFFSPFGFLKPYLKGISSFWGFYRLFGSLLWKPRGFG